MAKKKFIPPKLLTKHPLKNPNHANQRRIKPGVLAIDSNDEKVHMVAVVPELDNQLRDDGGICVIFRVIKANCIDYALNDISYFLIFLPSFVLPDRMFFIPLKKDISKLS